MKNTFFVSVVLALSLAGAGCGGVPQKTPPSPEPQPQPQPQPVPQAVLELVKLGDEKLAKEAEFFRTKQDLFDFDGKESAYLEILGLGSVEKPEELKFSSDFRVIKPEDNKKDPLALTALGKESFKLQQGTQLDANYSLALEIRSGEEKKATMALTLRDPKSAELLLPKDKGVAVKKGQSFAVTFASNTGMDYGLSGRIPVLYADVADVKALAINTADPKPVVFKMFGADDPGSLEADELCYLEAMIQPKETAKYKAYGLRIYFQPDKDKDGVTVDLAGYKDKLAEGKAPSGVSTGVVITCYTATKKAILAGSRKAGFLFYVRTEIPLANDAVSVVAPEAAKKETK